MVFRNPGTFCFLRESWHEDIQGFTVLLMRWNFLWQILYLTDLQHWVPPPPPGFVIGRVDDIQPWYCRQEIQWSTLRNQLLVLPSSYSSCNEVRNCLTLGSVSYQSVSHTGTSTVRRRHWPLLGEATIKDRTCCRQSATHNFTFLGTVRLVKIWHTAERWWHLQKRLTVSLFNMKLKI